MAGKNSGMSGGTISGNTASEGGGVYIIGTFTMSGGQISENTADSGGGIFSFGTFNMQGNASVSGNTVKNNGGGVYVYGIIDGWDNKRGSFTMNSGEIYGNTASNLGGGVYVDKKGQGFFNKKGGTIYGYTNGDSKSNIVKDSSGVVQNNKGHAIFIDDAHFRDSTLDPKDNPDPSKNGLAGGWGY